jgi:hypothetical protein
MVFYKPDHAKSEEKLRNHEKSRAITEVDEPRGVVKQRCHMKSMVFNDIDD